MKKEKKSKEQKTKKVRKPKEVLTIYGIPYDRSCHKGMECGIQGLSCKNPNCPHT